MSVKGKRMRYNQNSLVQQSLSLGKGRNYFHGMQTTNPDKFKYLINLGEGNLELGYHNYIDERQDILDEFLNKYSELEDRRSVTAFSRAYNYNKSTFARYGERVIKSNVSYKLLMKLKKIVIQIDEYIEKNTRRIG